MRSLGKVSVGRGLLMVHEYLSSSVKRYLLVNCAEKSVSGVPSKMSVAGTNRLGSEYLHYPILHLWLLITLYNLNWVLHSPLGSWAVAEDTTGSHSAGGVLKNHELARDSFAC